MQALIVRDFFDNETTANQLRSELSCCNNIVEIQSLNQWESAKIKLNIEEPCLYFPNIFLRYRNVALTEILNFHNSNTEFTTLTAYNTNSGEQEIVSFIPSKVTKTNKTSNSFNFPYNPFIINNLQFSYSVPQTETPILFLYTHNRSEYLKLTLSSLNYSMIEPIQIKILLNAATPEIKTVALAFAENKPNIEVFDISPNSFFSAINLAIQWFKPKKFIIAEDDFILPVTAKTYFPNWAHQFMDRLNYFDAVGWPWSLDNSPPYFDASRHIENCFSDWIVEYKNGYNLGGHCAAINTDFHLKAFKQRMSRQPINPYYVPFDGDLQAIATKICVPSLKGYHIGFNQEMDGYNKRTVNSQHPLQYSMMSLTTREERKFNLGDLYA